MNTTEFVYVTYINTTPEKLWGALLDNEMIKQYWATTRMFQTGRSDQTGYIKTTIAARLTLREKFSRLTSRGVWFSPGPEPGMSCSAEKASRVTFKIEPFLDVARLTLTHDK